MNDRLNELTKQIQDAIDEIGTMFPVISVSTNKDQGLRFLLLDERDIADNFPGYIRVPLPRGSDRFNSEVYVTLNGMKFHTYSELEAPAGYDKVVVAQPERKVS